MDKKSFLGIEIGTIALVVLAVIIFALFSNYHRPARPFSVLLPIPFTSQAPNGNWDRNEDCEETSITMVMAFLNGQTGNTISPADAQKSINLLKDWENANIGYNQDTGAEATTRMAEGAFGLKVSQIRDFTEDDLKKALSENHPVLLPINAKLMNNPKYINGGPQYHMIVIRGYRLNGKFVVNDPGTVEGNGNEYTFETLKNAAADWNHPAQQMEPNSKIALVLSK
jgi:hypothetical protein